MPDPENDDSIREEQQRPDHEDRHHGPHQEEPEEPVQVPEYQLESQPIVNGRQPSRPGQPGRWEAEPGDRDEPGRARAPEQRPQGQHEKA
jgi:hypothetical protein